MDFFATHSWIFLIGITFFPRITLLFSSVVSGGFMWWLGWFFTPHILVAILAMPYWDTNPFMVAIAWVIAMGGTRSEVSIVGRKKKIKYTIGARY